MIVLALAIVARVYALTVTRERDILREVMMPEEARNVISAAELDATGRQSQGPQALSQSQL